MDKEFGLMPSQSILDIEEISNQSKSIPKAMLFSMIIPGSGELYCNNDSGYFFMMLELGLVGSYFIYHKKGLDKQIEYRKFGDRHWNKERYKENAEAQGDEEAMEKEADLPSEKDSRYYDMIGKEDAFSYGWDSDKSRQDYNSKMDESKNQLKIASICVGVTIINHVFSAINALRSTKRFNSRIKEKARSDKDFKVVTSISRDKTELGFRITY
ncbi:MAG: hypothetical protein JXA60_00740 [Candidatus Coatesbacteria bacterium]|nr:hypothetical protein [Candidatus Coatesbacteria bacterium]